MRYTGNLIPPHMARALPAGVSCRDHGVASPVQGLLDRGFVIEVWGNHAPQASPGVGTGVMPNPTSVVVLKHKVRVAEYVVEGDFRAPGLYVAPFVPEDLVGKVQSAFLRLAEAGEAVLAKGPEVKKAKPTLAEVVQAIKDDLRDFQM